MPARPTQPATPAPVAFDGPAPFVPPPPPPPPVYVPPSEGPVARDRKRCIDCRRVLPRATSYDLKWTGDPYGLADRERARLRRRLRREPIERKPTELELAQCRHVALQMAPKPGARIQIQSVCRECSLHRQRRLTALRALEGAAAEYGVTVERGEFARTAHLESMPPALCGLDVLEPLARAGVVVMNGRGAVLPAEPVDALRVCYAACLSPHRTGALGRERAALLNRIPALAAKAPKHRMARCAEDVRDVILVREGGACADAAAKRLVARLWKLRQKKAQAMLASGALDRFQVGTRLLEGIYDAITSWNPIHESGAALKTHAYNRIGRALQLRGRKDFTIAAQKGDDGRWHGGAASLHTLMPSDEDQLVPHAVPYHTAHQAAVCVRAENRNGGFTEAAQRDVSAALAALSPVDRLIATRLWMSPGSVTTKQIAEEAGLDVADVRARSRQVRALLVCLLKDYDADPE